MKILYWYWTGYGFYIYFTFKGLKYCFRFITQFQKFSQDERRFAIWRLK